MHEASILLYALEAIERAATSNKLTQVTEIRLSIGKQRAALPDALQFLFSALRPASIFENAILRIEELGIVVRCAACGDDSHLEFGDPYRCASCGNEGVSLIQGDELEIAGFAGR